MCAFVIWMLHTVLGTWAFNIGATQLKVDALWYLIRLFVCSFVIRGIMVSLITWERRGKGQRERGPIAQVWYHYWSRPRAPFGIRDYFHPWILGTLELGAYAILIAADKWLPIGAWLAYKTYGASPKWEDRGVYNRFLIGNALVLLGSFIVSRAVTVG